MQQSQWQAKGKKHAIKMQLHAVITIIEAVQLTGTPRETIKDAIKAKKIVARQSGKTWLMRKIDALNLWGARDDITTGGPVVAGGGEED